MRGQAAHNSQWRTADIIFGTSLVLGLVLDYFWPARFGALSGSMVRHLIGAPMLIGGSLIIVFAKRELMRWEQPSEPLTPTTRIVREGIFRYSRNPMYTGLSLCFAGLSFAIDKPWLLILLFPTLVAVQRVLILPEEKYLEEKFGDEFLQYKRSVRRWF